MMSDNEINNESLYLSSDQERGLSGFNPGGPEDKIVKRSLFRKVINSFIVASLVIIIALLLIVGFTQTKTFREFLRKEIISIVNKETNGKLNIEKLDGTLLTSLLLRNTSIVVDNDTLLFANTIEVKTNPAQLLLKKIYIRKVLIQDAKIQMLQDADGKWNIGKFIKPTPEDTSKSTFSFIIHAPDIQFRNISFLKQSFGNHGSRQIYSNANFDDIRLQNLNFSAEAIADIESSNFLLILKELSFEPNLTRFKLRYISGEFAVTKKFVSINKFYFRTDSSEVKINARIDSINLLGKIGLNDFKNCPVTVDAKASPFNFDDLSSFINATEILKGNPSFELRARGKFGAFKIDKAKLDFRDTHFDFSGQVLNLNNPSKLYLQAKVTDTDFDYKDVNALLPWLKLPSYAKMVLTNVNIEYEGEPTNFKTKFSGNVNDGNIEGEGSMNVAKEPMTYDIKFACSNLNLEALTNFPTSINARGSIAGQGTNPFDLYSDLKLNVFKSMINKYSIDKFDVTANARDKKFELNIDTEAEGAKSMIMGNLIYDKDTVPSYSLIGDVKNLNAARFANDDKYNSKLNLYFSLEGKSIDPDEINATFSFGIDSSYFQNKWINSSLVEAKIKKDSDHREILLSSDFVDFRIDGTYSLKKAIELVGYESKTISDIISKKLLELNPLSVVDKPVYKDTISTPIPEIVNEDLKFNYDFKFKDFKLVALLMGNDQLDISGSGSGYVSNINQNFSVYNKMNLDYIIMMQKGTTIYLSDFGGEFNFTRDNRSNSFDRLFGSASITGKRFYSGSNIKSLNADVTFNQSKIFFNISANYDDLIKADGDGIVFMTPGEQKFMISNLNVDYDGIDWQNRDTLKASFNPQYFRIIDFKMFRDTSMLSASGLIENTGNQNLTFTASKISGDILEKYFFGIKNSGLKADGSVIARIEGKFENPIINVLYHVNDLKLEGNKLGNIKGYLSYEDKKMKTNFAFLDEKRNEQKPLFLFNGKFPVDLSFASVKERFLKSEPVDIRLTSDNFNLSQLGRIIPGITDQAGILTADLQISGSVDSPDYSGYINLKDGFFKSVFNNLDYSCGAKVTFEGKGLRVDSLICANAGGTNYPGEIKGLGTIMFDGFKMKDVNLRFFGDIALLGQKTQSISPFFYGDLKVSTDGDWTLTKKGDKFFFKGNMLMEKTDLFYTTGRDEGLTSNRNVNLIYLVDSSKIDKEQIRFQKILEREKTLQDQLVSNVERKFDIDYEMGITSGKESRLTFILAQAFNQKLIVEMKGSMRYGSINNEPHAQGRFELLPGSRLEFFKTFDATGTLRFEDDVTNPNLDIISTYTSDYYDPRYPDSKPEPAAVKIKIYGSVFDLGKTLATDQNALGVYIGADNIQRNVKDPRYDYADALSFIISGKFKNDLTAQDKTAVANKTAIGSLGSAATSFFGTLLSSFVNSTVGDLVNNISINQTGETYKFSLGGRIENFTYSIGGSTETFNNIATTNFMLQYRFFPTNLNVRFERKDPLTRTYGLDEKILEMALKYKFEF